MIESQNPEIDVQELMARVRAEVEKRKARPPAPPVGPLATPASATGAAASPFHPLREKITVALNRARQKNHVSSRIPALIHPFFRNQGGFNLQLLRAIELQAQQIDALQNELTNIQQASRSEVADLRAALVDSLNQIKALQAGTSEQVDGLHGALKEQQAQCDSAQQQIRALESQLVDLADRPMPRIPSLDMDALYLAFENEFRGSREDIKERQRIYLPYLAEAGVGTADKPILDLGCGRGEWLEVLSENGYTACGVDLNVSMASMCRELGLNVLRADATTHLKSLPEQSLGAITGFHVIEHLPFDVMVEWFHQCRRCVQPGGLAIFESPNCKNLVVGACNFHSDPTHRNPVFPDTAKFILEQVGFSSADILYLAPVPGSPFHQEAPDAAMLHDWFFGPRDFAVIAKK